MNYYVLKDNVETRCVYGIVATEIDSNLFNTKIATILDYLNNNNIDWMIDDVLARLPHEWKCEFIGTNKIENIYI